ncbi:MAG: polyhydroxyalkanoate synthesis repressor PhaR [Gammaproteobacteria bacterium]|jgi:polyhydroxyalkanoate synthesis repressor PhaR|nr:polyhydroxyalkanoate synthesis repressor PhaR [Gammaproteobacteria bacterium]MBT4615203.1 polyhydroxyalkanoate synthesis repressor PhaR [Gammaproteobacteria bacterium]MBT5197237.1 polyhydroxyalkanoate synthesis repressor PhaR [Gammaproteobacteria bacterium]MBT6667749.1 polyhydroxyalkanoate synthesis repressor PhaR [Gammaproteobacteria bacterium]MBT7176993.1 polyhydroxyalkanoate synthesis repressor PhaR [Gammaproteobacteria bacterium]
MLQCNIASRARVFATYREVGENSLFNAQKSEICGMRAYKKYPNRRLYDIEESKYVTVEDIRKVILKGESITVVDSKTEKNLSRTVLMQIISEQEGDGHEPILTNRVLEQMVRFYGGAMQSIVGGYIEQSIMTFLEHQERYKKSVRDITSSDPLAMMRGAMEKNMDFWNKMTQTSRGPDKD